MIQERNSLCGKILGVIIFQICVSVKWVDIEFVLIIRPTVDTGTAAEYEDGEI